MKQFKKMPRKQIEKFSIIFMQLGLVLALFVVFISLEYETEQKEVFVDNLSDSGTDVYTLDLYKTPVFVKEVEVKQQRKKQIREVFLNEIVAVKDKKEIIETVITKKTDDDIQQINVGDIITIEEPDDIDVKDEPKPIVIDLVSRIPVFKGCENLSKAESRKCLDKKISKLVKRTFDVDLANELGLKTGKHKMYTQFVIDKTGKVVDVKVGTKNKDLEKEAKRVVGKIPDFTPGESNGEKVSVKYTLPINFYVQ